MVEQKVFGLLLPSKSLKQFRDGGLRVSYYIKDIITLRYHNIHYIITIFRPMRINSIVTRGCTDDKALTVFSPVQNITKQHAIRAVIFLHPHNTLPTPPYLWDHTPPAPIRIAPSHGALCQCFIVRAMRLIVVSISQCSCRPTSPFLPVFFSLVLLQ